MIIDISLMSISSLAITGILTYVAGPLLLVARDKVFWWYVNRFILNDHLRALIAMRAGDIFEIQEKYGSSASWQISTAGLNWNRWRVGLEYAFIKHHLPVGDDGS